ncbi:hypothetical protein WMF30_35775 [Sorangium sp. So ce134]
MMALTLEVDEAEELLGVEEQRRAENQRQPWSFGRSQSVNPMRSVPLLRGMPVGRVRHWDWQARAPEKAIVNVDR